ncbi:MAG TPA: hypothetical protein DHW82_10890 [Spirochaetia bacterium]|nr:MAG: hypothetical protein A2Y41_11555 [Spirochaetes bacterium GWB1_36_13]HCL57499.1 hypothetical protein [Spirochaetia bacterium]
MEKEEILKVQEACNLILNKKLGEDGIWGPKTKEALMELQKEIKVTPDGIYGPKTKNGIGIKISELFLKAESLKAYFTGSSGSSQVSSNINDFM